MYRHQLFHRDRPEELHLLRRRTCPGVDGRKQRVENESASGRSHSPRPTSRRNSLSNDDLSDDSIVLSSSKNKRKIKSFAGKVELKRPRRVSGNESKRNNDLESDNDDEKSVESVQPKTTCERESPSSVMDPVLMTHVVPPESDDIEGQSELSKRMVSPNIFGESMKRERSSSFEQSMLVSRVSRKLEEHARKAAAAKGFNAKRRSGTVTPPYYSDTMKYHALTYDDEFEIYDSARGCVVERQQRITVLNDSDESYSVISNDDEDKIPRTNGDKETKSTPPVQNSIMVAEIVRKLHGWAKQSSLASKVDGQLAAAITGFCMSTNPCDSTFEEKCIELMQACGSVVNEFRHYKIALLPGCPQASGLPTRNTSRPAQIKQLLNCDKKNTLRAFKVFSLNILEDLINDKELVLDVGLNQSEKECMTICHHIWMHSLRQF